MQKIEATLQHFKDSATLSANLASVINASSEYAYVHDARNGEDLFASEAIKLGCEIMTKAHPPETAEGGRGVFMVPGCMFLDLDPDSLATMVLSVNEARKILADSYAQLNKLPGHINKANKLLVERIKSGFIEIPGVIRGAGLSIKQVTRSVHHIHDVDRVTFYRERQCSSRKITAAYLDERLSLFTPEKEDYLRSKIAGIPISSLRFRHLSQYRYRANIQKDGWGNLVISNPLLITGKRPDVRTVQESSSEHLTRSDMGNYEAVLPELNIYAKK